MKTYSIVWMLATFIASLLALPIAHTQTTSSQSNYTFRFNTGISSVFLNNSTFASQQSLNLGSCTTVEKINGPLSCAVNCQNESVCLLDLSGPSGATVNDIIEKVSQTPLAASPTPSNSASPSANSNPSAFGALIQIPGDPASRTQRRIEAYNQSHTLS